MIPASSHASPQMNTTARSAQSQATDLIGCTLLTLKVVKAAVPFSTAHIYRLMDMGDFPRPLKIGKRRVAWRADDIRDWISEREKVAV